jgi:hypothetical protein
MQKKEGSLAESEESGSLKVVVHPTSRRLSPALAVQHEAQMIPKAVLQLHDWGLVLQSSGQREEDGL